MGSYFKLSPPSASVVKCVCGRCKIETTHKLIAEYVECGSDEFHGGAYTVNWQKIYRMLQCAGCDEMVYASSYWNSEAVDPGTDLPEEEVEYYPSRPIVEAIDSSVLAPNLAQIYDETIAAISGDMPILAAIGLRALIEAICKERSASGRNLEEKIDSLVPKGIVTKQGAEMLHSLRILGNIAAHEVEAASSSEIKAAFAVVSHMMHGTYVLPQLIGVLPVRTTPVETPPPTVSGGGLSL